MRKLPHTAAEDLLEIIMRRYERASTLLTSNRPVDDWGKLSATPPPSARCSIGCCITRRAQMRATELAHQGPDRLAAPRERATK